jgi:Ca2+-binding RTX toxin-like protein
MFRPNATRLSLEALAARDVPAILFNPATGVLNIDGTGGNDTVRIDHATNLFGAATIDVRLVSVGNDGILRSEFRWFYADDVSRIEFHGGEGNDVLDAPFFRVVAFGDGGDDRITAIGRLFGGAGNDVLTATASSGGNVLDGGTENDVLTGSNNADTLRGGAGWDVLRGRGGVDYLYGDDGNDTLRGGVGNDWAYGGAGDDAIYGEDGNDTLFGDAGGDFIDGAAGRDTIFGDGFLPAAADGNDWLLGGANLDHIYAGGGDDFVDGGLDMVHDVIFLGPGRDAFASYPIGHRDSSGGVFAIVAQDQFPDVSPEDVGVVQPLRVL